MKIFFDKLLLFYSIVEKIYPKIIKFYNLSPKDNSMYERLHSKQQNSLNKSNIHSLIDCI